LCATDVVHEFLPLKVWLDGVKPNTLFDTQISSIEIALGFLGGEEFAADNAPAVVERLNKLRRAAFDYSIVLQDGTKLMSRWRTEFRIFGCDHHAHWWALGGHGRDR